MTKPLKVFNLSDGDQWFKNMSVVKLEKSKKRLIDRTSKSIPELEEDFHGSGNKPRKPTETELDIYAKFVEAAIQKKLKSPVFTE